MTLADCVRSVEDHRLRSIHKGPYVLPHALVVIMQQVCPSKSVSLTEYLSEREALVPRGADARTKHTLEGVLPGSCLLSALRPWVPEP